MSKAIRWLNLQLFAGEGGAGTGSATGNGGGEAAATGENSAVAGQDEEQRLLELGVPKEVLERRAKRRAANPSTVTKTKAVPAAEAKREPPASKSQPESPSETKTEEPVKTEETPTRMSWEEIMADPEYNKQMQLIVQSRLKDAKLSEEKLAKLTPALEVLARHYKQDYENLDVDALVEAVNGDRNLYEDIALAQGLPVEQVMQKDQTDRDTARQQRMEAQTIEQQRINRHIEGLVQQGEALKAIFPNFDLRTELKNPQFARLVSPGVGLSVEDAYHTIHRAEIQAAQAQVTAQKTAEMISRSIQSGQRRPVENGTSGQAPSTTTFDWRNASKEQREALKRRVQEAAARGEKVYPGQY